MESVKDVLEDGCFKGNDISLFFSDHDDEEMHPSPDFLPIITHPATTELALFSFASYKDFLETKQLGQLVVYSEVITSTQTVLDGYKRVVIYIFPFPVCLINVQYLAVQYLCSNGEDFLLSVKLDNFDY